MNQTLRQQVDRHPRRTAPLARMRGAMPAALAFAVPFGLAVTACIAGRMLLAEQAVGVRFQTMVTWMFAAGTLAGATAWLAAAGIAGHRPPTARAAAMLIALAAATAGYMAIGQFLAFRLAEAVPGSGRDFPSVLYFLNILGGILSSAYLTVTVALRLLLPAGLIALFAGTLLFVRYGADRRG